MAEVCTIGLDLAKHVFQAHGADASGAVLFRKKLRRAQVLSFFATQPPGTVAMEACGSAHHWAREIGKLGHAVRLIPPAYVKPFVKRQKNDAADAQAICEAAQRPTMRFVAPKSEQAQAAALVFRARDLLVRQRTQIINALRGHLAEFGIVVAQGPAHVSSLVRAVEDPAEPVPEIARAILSVLIEMLHTLDGRISLLDREIAQRAKEDVTARRLMTIPGVGPITATALTALAPPAETFKRGRDFAAWIGLNSFAAFDRRQAEAGGHLEDGRANSASPADHRGECCPALGGPSWRASRIVAVSHAGPQAADAGAGSIGQQDGPHRLGLDGQRWGLPSSGRERVSARVRGAVGGVGKSKGRDGATVDETGSGKPECNSVP